MNATHRRWGAAGVVLLLVGAGVFVWHHRDASKKALEAPVQQEATRWRGFGANEPRFASGPSSGEVVSKPQLGATMAAWREGILNKDADTVSQLDQTFVDHPALYGPELLKMAEKEPNERVRAFCTRVLGKLKNVELAAFFQHLLGDASPFVRQNAAWALGELAAQPAGREAAQMAEAELRQAEEEDSSPDVRVAAGKALEKLK